LPTEPTLERWFDTAVRRNMIRLYPAQIYRTGRREERELGGTLGFFILIRGWKVRSCTTVVCTRNMIGSRKKLLGLRIQNEWVGLRSVGRNANVETVEVRWAGNGAPKICPRKLEHIVLPSRCWQTPYSYRNIKIGAPGAGFVS
jgi:hypothetical protein